MIEKRYGFIRKVVVDRGYGFIQEFGGGDFFFNRKGLPEDELFNAFLLNQDVTFQLTDNPMTGEPMAVNIQFKE